MNCNRRCTRGGSIYVFSNTEREYNDAIRNCRSVGGELVTNLNSRRLNQLSSCCNLQQPGLPYWIGLFRNNGCPGQRFPYQWIGSSGTCLSEFPLAIQPERTTSDCIGVALERTSNGRVVLARERRCRSRARFICKFQAQPEVTTTTSTITTAPNVQSTTAANFTTAETLFSEQNEVQATTLPSGKSTVDLIVKGAIGGGVAFIALLFVIAVISLLRKRDKKEETRACRIETDENRHSRMSLPDSYYSIDPIVSKRRSNLSRRTLSIPIDPEAAHYIFPDTTPSPKINDFAYHEYVEIDHCQPKSPIEPTYEKVGNFNFNSNDKISQTKTTDNIKDDYVPNVGPKSLT